MNKSSRKLLSTLFAITIFAAAVNLASVRALADDEGCSAAAVNGSYGVQTSGFIVAFGPIGPVAEVGVLKFDGAGKVSSTTTVSLNGAIVPNRSSVSGAYQVYPDCTGDMALVLPGAPGTTITSTSHFVIVDNGKELRLVNTGAGRVLLSNAKRQ